MFETSFLPQAERALRKLDSGLVFRIDKKIDKLREDSYPSDCKRLINSDLGEKIFRVRVGDYRILYEVVTEDCVILIHRIDKRSRVYVREEIEDYSL